jgi:glutathione S-transferase
MKIYHAPRLRSHRIVWLCEEMGVPYEIVPVNFTDPSPEFVALNPLRSLPVLQDGDTTMIESIAIMLYIIGKHGPTPLARIPTDPDYARYLNFLVFGEAGITMYGNPLVATKIFGPKDAGDNWTTGYCADTFAKRLAFLETQLAGAPYILGEDFSAADISVAFPLGVAKFITGAPLSPTLQAYHDRLTARPAHQRAAAA